MSSANYRPDDMIVASATAKRPVRKHWVVVLVAVIIVLVMGCGMIPERVNFDDERVAPLFEAMARVDREALGFTQIPKTARLFLEGASERYDAMLHTDEGMSSRTVAFRLTDSGYEWLAEQLTFWGPKDFETIDGTIKEHITITYEVGPVSVSGYSVGRLHISYWGEDDRLTSKDELEMFDVLPMINDWRESPKDIQ